MESTAVEVYEDMNQALTFGKYRGQPVSVLAGDKSYCDWLVAQDWFRQKYQNVYNVIINNFSKPEDTPEHNSLQAMFLDEDFVKKFCVLSQLSGTGRIEKIEFERNGWDVYLSSYGWAEANIEIKPVIGDDFPTVMRQMTNNSVYSYYDPSLRRQASGRINPRCCQRFDEITSVVLA